MIRCPNCGEENPPGQDFCIRCESYLRWELSGAMPAVGDSAGASRTAKATGGPAHEKPPTDADGEPPALEPSSHRDRLDTAVSRSVSPARPPADAGGMAPDERVELTLRHAEDSEGLEGPLAVQVAPGSAAFLVAEIGNRTRLVDHFHVRISGLPDEWYSVSPSTVRLNPYGAPGEHEGEVQVRLQPPRSPRAEARAWRFSVEVVSEDRQAQVASTDATLVIEPYEDFAAEVRPERRGGRRRARFDVRVRNRANAPIDVDVAAADEEETCRIEVEQARVTVAPGAETRSGFTAYAPKPIWFGRPVDRNLSVTARSHGSDLERPPNRAVFRHRPWLPWWLPIAAVVILALLLLALKLLPHNTDVPDLRGAKSPFAAQQRLTRAGLKIAPNPQRRVTGATAAGEVVDQDPPPGQQVEKGSAVTVVQAVGSSRRAVPSVKGLSVQDADRALREAGLVLGTMQPQATDTTRKIAAQLPAAGLAVEEGTAVNVSLEAGKKPGQTVPEPKKSKKAGGGPATGAGVPGGAAAARTSRLAFDDGVKVSVWDPATKLTTPLTTSGTASRPVVEPTWSADGTQLAYMRVGPNGHGRIFVADVQAGESSARPVDDGKGNYHRPSFSPTGKLLAYIKKEDENGGKVCLQANDGRPHAPSCLSAGDWKFRGQPAWSPDARSMLVVASSRRRKELSGLFQYVTSRPGSSRAKHWRPASDHLALPIAHASFVAWSPSGRQVAVMASPDGAQYHLNLIAAQPAGPKGAQRSIPDVRGCEAAWRPDGLLAVSVYDCSQPVAAAGQLVLVDPLRPSSLTQLPGVHGRNPAWQPRSGG